MFGASCAVAGRATGEIGVGEIGVRVELIAVRHAKRI
jgi:hypothetical protein